MNTLKRKIKSVIKGSKLLLNLNLDLCKIQKKALIIYTHDIFYKNLNIEGISHTNIIEANQIIKCFAEEGYAIDLIHCEDFNSVSKIYDNTYDVIFGFGDIFKEMCDRNENAIKIVYLTENPPEVSYKRELERISYYKERYNKNLKVRRSGKYYNESNLKGANYGIVLGETNLYNNYNFEKFSIKPTGFFNDNYIFKDRNFDISKKNFLWFGSHGAIHKGLDLLIDVFAENPDLTLHICGLNKKEKKELRKFPSNIIEYGFVDVKSDKYLEIANKCSFVIMPSCSEGFSTSVATCMRHSMIPIVQVDTGFNNLKEVSYILDDFKIEYIDSKIKEISNTDIDDLRRFHKKVYLYANSEFNINKFTTRFSQIIASIIRED